MELSVETNKNGKIEIHAVASVTDVAHGKEHALGVFSPYVEIMGFRKGKAPHNLVEAQVKSEKLIEETVAHIAQDAYEQAVKDHKLSPITEPHVLVDILEENKEEMSSDLLWPLIQKDGVSLTITTFMNPEISLGKWQKAVEKVEKPKVNDDKPAPVIETATSIEDAKQKSKDATSEDSSGVDEISDTQKVEQARHEYNDAILDAIIAEAHIDVAEELIAGEAQQMIMQQVQIVQQLGINYEEFLKNQGKTIEDIENETKKAAERTVKGRFVLTELAHQFEKELPENPTFQQVLAIVEEKAKTV